MQATESFRQHHTDLLQIAGEISKSLNIDQLRKNAESVRALLSKLTGKLIVHLAMEDNSLYPSLMKSADPGVKAAAERFSREMGGIKAAFGEYTKKWGTASLIQNDPAAFIKETREVFAALSKRIDKEDRELYPLVDGLRAA